MEDWEKNQIRVHLPKLISLTQCNEIFLSTLQASDVLKVEENQAIVAKETQVEKAKLVYTVVQAKVSGYGSLALALKETGQTGAYQILLSGFLNQDPRDILRAALQNSPQKHIVDHLSTKALNNAIELHKEEYLKTFMLKSLNEQEFRFFNNIIPAKSPYYIERHISNRVILHADIFKQKCPDIFVFKDIEAYELTKLAEAANELTATSSSQIDKLTRRFILLECVEDFYDICKLADNQKPVHLIKIEWYSDELNCDNHDKQRQAYIVEQSTGQSKIIWEFAIDKNNERRIFLSEDDFLEKLDDFDIHSRGFCICDSPGMGKSWVLESIARKLKEKNPESLTLFFSVVNLSIEYQENTCPLNMILDVVCSREITKEIILKSIKDKSLTVNLFFDGFDEMEQSKLQESTKFIKQILESSPNTRIFVTSRPHLRRALEILLNVIAYDIKPFDRQDQINCFKKYWCSELTRKQTIQAKQRQNIIQTTDRLQEFAEFCQKKIQEHMTPEQGEILGLPLHCRMFAVVNLVKAHRYAEQLHQTTDKLDVNFHLGSMYSEFMVTKLPSGETTAKRYFVWKALGVFSGKLADLYKDALNVNTDYSEDIILKLGIVEKRFEGGDKPKLKFVHQTFAEYLIAELITEMCYQTTLCQKYKQLSVELFEFLKNDVYRFEDYYKSKLEFGVKYWPPTQPKHDHLPTLNLEDCANTVIPFLFNLHLRSYTSQKVCKEIVPLIFDRILPNKLFKILLICAKLNHLQVLRFFTNALQSPGAKTKLNKLYYPFLRSKLVVGEIYYDPKYNKATFWSSYLIISVATCYADVELLEECVEFFKTCADEDVFETVRYLPPWLKTPLHFALIRGDYHLVEYFISKNLPMEHRCYLYYCIADSYNKSLRSVHKRIDICNLLLNKHRFLINESAKTEYLTLENPLALPNISLELYKHLARRNSERIHSYVVDEEIFVVPKNLSKKYSAFGSVAKFMQEDDLHELCIFLIDEIHIPEIFQFEDGCRCPLAHILWHCPTVKLDTVIMLLNVLNRNQLVKCFPDVLLCASKTNPQVLDILIKHGANIDVIFDDSENMLHHAARNGNMPLTGYLLDRGVAVNQRNVKGASPMNVAYNYPTIIKVLLKHEGKLSFEHPADNTMIKNLSTQRWPSVTYTAEFNDLITHLATLKDTMHFLMGAKSSESTPSKNCPLVHLTACSYISLYNIKLLWEFCEPQTCHLFETLTKHSILHKAVRHNEEFEVIKFFISKGLDYQAKDNDNNTILHFAVEQNKHKLVKYLLDTLKMSVTETNKSRDTPLHLAKNWKLANVLMQCGTDPMLQNKFGKTFIHAAAHFLCESEFKELLETLQDKLCLSLDDALKSCVNQENETLLHIRIRWRRGPLDTFTEHVIKTSWGAIHSFQDNNRLTILNRLAEKQQWYIVNILLKTNLVKNFDILSEVLKCAVSSENFESVNILHSISNDFVKLSLIHARSVQMARFLRNLGADLDVVDSYGDTVLHKVKDLDSDYFFELTHYVKVECKCDAMLVRKNKENQTDLHTRIAYVPHRPHICHMTPTYIIKEFLSVQNYEINSIDIYGHSLLMTAVLNWPFVGLKGIQCILEFGANPESVTHKNKNLLHFAVRSADIDAVNFCLALGIQPNNRKKFTFTPIDLTLKLLSENTWYMGPGLKLESILEVLLTETFRNHAQCVAKDSVDGNTILHQAAKYGRPKDFHRILIKTLQKGVLGNCYVKNKHEMTPLQIAAAHFEVLDETLQVMQENGIDVLS